MNSGSPLRLMSVDALSWDVLNSLSDEIIIIDSDYQILFANKAKHRMYPEEGELRGKKCFQVFEGRTDGPCKDCLTAQAFSGTTIGPVWHDYNRRGDPTNKKTCELTAAPCRVDQNQRVTAVIEVVRDQTYRSRLHDATAKLERALDARDVYDIVLDAVRGLGFDRVRHYALSRNGRLLVGRKYIGPPDARQEALFSDGTLAIDLTDRAMAFSKLTLKHRRPIVFQTFGAGGTKPTFVRQDGARSVFGPVTDPLAEQLDKEDVVEWIELPLQVGQRTIGLISVDRKNSKKPCEDWEYQLVSTFCRLAAQALVSAQSRAESELQQSIAARFRSGMPIERALQETLQQVAVLVGARDCWGYIRLADDSRQNLSMLTGTGEHWHLAPKNRPWGELVSGQVAQTRTPIIVNDAVSVSAPDLRRLRADATGPFLKDARSYACLPLITASSEAIGTMSLSSRYPNAFVGHEFMLERLAAVVAQVVDAKSMQLHREVAEEITHILAMDAPSKQNLEQVLTRIAKSTMLSGCVLYLKTNLFFLLADSSVEHQALSEAFWDWLLAVRGWGKDALADPQKEKLHRMLCSFLGVDTQGLGQVLWHAGTPQELAQLMCSSLYLVTIQSGDLEAPAKAAALLRSVSLREPSPQRNEEVGQLLVNYAYLPGYGLTGWSLRYGTALRWPCEQSRANRSATTASPTRFTPNLGPVTRIVRSAGVRTILDEHCLPPPEPAQHLIDSSSDLVASDSVLLAYPLEEIDTIDMPAGVLRASITQSEDVFYSSEATTAMREASRLFSWIIRRAYMLQEAFVGKHADKRLLLGYLRHKVERHRHLAVAPSSAGEEAQDHGLPLVARLQDALQDLVTGVDVYQKLLDRAHLMDRILRGGCTTYRGLRDAMKAFLDDALPRGVAVSVEATPGVLGSAVCQRLYGCALSICLLAEEIIRNHLEHASRDPAHGFFAVRLLMGPYLKIAIFATGSSLSDTSCPPLPGNMRRYADLLCGPNTRPGGGTLLLLTLTATGGLDVSEGYLDNGHRVYVVHCGGCALTNERRENTR